MREVWPPHRTTANLLAPTTGATSSTTLAPPAGRWRTTCECGWISNWSATSAGLLELLPLDGRLRPVGTRTVASFVTSEHVVVLVGYNEPFGSYFA